MYDTEWLPRQWPESVAPPTLRAYANTSRHFVRWWSRQPGVDTTRFTAEQFTESRLVDYVRDQPGEHPKPGPENINQRTWYRRSPPGYGRGRIAAAPADLKLKVPQRVIVPLSAEQVARFWRSFRTARDLALVAFMLLNGLRAGVSVPARMKLLGHRTANMTLRLSAFPPVLQGLSLP